MERISSGGRELKVAILVDCGLGGYGVGMEWNEDGIDGICWAIYTLI